jgi:hypothetical protein
MSGVHNINPDQFNKLKSDRGVLSLTLSKDNLVTVGDTVIFLKEIIGNKIKLVIIADKGIEIKRHDRGELK